MQHAYDAYVSSDWQIKPAIERGAVLIKVAEKCWRRGFIWRRRLFKNREKIMNEALADVDEAIDFLQFYARQIIVYQQKNPTAHSRGVLAVITPWNFPLAIPCGMVAARSLAVMR